MSIDEDIRMPLTPREQALLEILERKPGAYPKQFHLEWLTEEYYATDPVRGKPNNPTDSVRCTMTSLGLKLAGARVGSITRVSARGRSQKGVYKLEQFRAWQVLDNVLGVKR